MNTHWMSKWAVIACALIAIEAGHVQAQRVRIGIGNGYRGGYGYYGGYGYRGYYQPYRGYYGYGRGYSPYYSGFGYYGPQVGVSVGGLPYYGDATAYYYNTPNAATPPVTSQSLYGNPSSAFANAARLTVILPNADGQVWLDATEMQSRGTVREFVSPPLERDKSYAYKVRAQWRTPEGANDETRTVTVAPGQLTTVDFTRPEAKPQQ